MGAFWSRNLVGSDVDTKRGVLYVTTGDNYSLPATTTSDAVAALDIKTGRVVWMRQILSGDAWTGACIGGGANCPADSGPDFDFGSSALLVHLANGRDILAVGQKSGVVYAWIRTKRVRLCGRLALGRAASTGASSGAWPVMASKSMRPSLICQRCYGGISGTTWQCHL